MWKAKKPDAGSKPAPDAIRVRHDGNIFMLRGAAAEAMGIYYETVNYVASSIAMG